ncbi:hypothetical protein PENTCL1PPCAC_14556, partial [Pristionchus entomophagus]
PQRVSFDCWVVRLFRGCSKTMRAMDATDASSHVLPHAPIDDGCLDGNYQRKRIGYVHFQSSSVSSVTLQKVRRLTRMLSTHRNVFTCFPAQYVLHFALLALIHNHGSSHPGKN